MPMYGCRLNMPSSSPSSIKGAAWRFPNVRVCNEGLLGPRVARGQGIAGQLLFSLLPRLIGRGRARWTPTARVQRGSSETARCTSTGDHLGCPLLLLIHDPAPDAGGRVAVSMEVCRISTIHLSSGSDVLSGGMRTITLPIGRSKSPRRRASIATRWPILASSG